MSSPSLSGHPSSVNTHTRAQSLQEESSMLSPYEQGILRVTTPAEFSSSCLTPADLPWNKWPPLTNQGILCNGTAHILGGLEVWHV